jgi:hypothetical protein
MREEAGADLIDLFERQYVPNQGIIMQGKLSSVSANAQT